MTCQLCCHTNLAGGVRCVYCGAHFPKTLDFEIEGNSPSPEAGRSTTSGPIKTKPRSVWGAVTGLGLIVFKWKSLFALFKLGPLLTTFSTMTLFIAAESRLFGWKL